MKRKYFKYILFSFIFFFVLSVKVNAEVCHYYYTTHKGYGMQINLDKSSSSKYTVKLDDLNNFLINYHSKKDTQPGIIDFAKSDFMAYMKETETFEKWFKNQSGCPVVRLHEYLSGTDMWFILSEDTMTLSFKDGGNILFEDLFNVPNDQAYQFQLPKVTLASSFNVQATPSDSLTLGKTSDGLYYIKRNDSLMPILGTFAKASNAASLKKINIKDYSSLYIADIKYTNKVSSTAPEDIGWFAINSLVDNPFGNDKKNPVNISIYWDEVDKLWDPANSDNINTFDHPTYGRIYTLRDDVSAEAPGAKLVDSGKIIINKDEKNKEYTIHNLADICKNEATVLKVMRFIGYALFIVKILVPIGLIAMGVITFAKVLISGNTDDLKKDTISFGLKIVIAIVIFVLPTIVNFLIGLIDGATDGVDDYKNCRDCILSPSDCVIPGEK